MESTPTYRRSWLRPRFSLRVALLALTAFGIGFLVWYRWPYEEVEQLPPQAPNLGPPFTQSRITTWQRQWGGGRLKHGTERFLVDGKTYSVTTYRNGRKHGPHVMHFLEIVTKGSSVSLVELPEPQQIGQFVDDQMEGSWTFNYDPKGAKQTIIYRNGKQVAP